MNKQIEYITKQLNMEIERCERRLDYGLKICDYSEAMKAKEQRCAYFVALQIVKNAIENHND